jgi:hypothetical protein
MHDQLFMLFYIKEKKRSYNDTFFEITKGPTTNLIINDRE